MSLKLEEILQQKEFLNDAHKAHIALLLGGYFISNKHQELFRSYGITMQQYNVLRILRGQFPEPCCLLVIKERILDKASDVSRLVARLKISGCVERTVSKTDQRYVEVIISEKGMAILNEIDKIFTDDFFKLGDLSNAEIQLLASLIERIL